jgi:hypothetical protein
MASAVSAAPIWPRSALPGPTSQAHPPPPVARPQTPRTEPPAPPDPVNPVEVEKPPVVVVIVALVEPPAPVPVLDVDEEVVVATHWPVVGLQASLDGQTTFSHG